jgi:hypothetical protein
MAFSMSRGREDESAPGGHRAINHTPTEPSVTSHMAACRHRARGKTKQKERKNPGTKCARKRERERKKRRGEEHVGNLNEALSQKSYTDRHTRLRDVGC